jgi:hypothetical protein
VPRNLAALPGIRKIQTMSDPELVRTVRRLTKDLAVTKLANQGVPDPKLVRLMYEARSQVQKRKLTIHHPEFDNE